MNQKYHWSGTSPIVLNLHKTEYWIRSCRQGSLQLYSTACLTARQLLRSHPVLSDSIRRLWRLISIHDHKQGLAFTSLSTLYLPVRS